MVGPSVDLVVALGLLASLLGPASAKIVQGTLRTSEDWTFVARFCFLSHNGRFEYNIEYNEEFAYQNLLLYYDSDTQWPLVYKTNKSCEEKQSILRRELMQIVPLEPGEMDSGCTEVSGPKKNSPVSIVCNSSKSFRSARERWWFLAISHCNFTKGLSLKYTFLMTNGEPGDFWHEHFSADEFFILPLLLGFALLYVFIIMAALICCSELKARQLLHSTYKVFLGSLVFQEVGIVAQALAYIMFATTGFEQKYIQYIGRIFESGSEICFLLLLLLIAKGYTITRARLSSCSTTKLSIFLSLYSAFYYLLFAYQEENFDPGEVLYLYESPAGNGLMCLRVAAWWMFIYSTIFTLKRYPEKTTFYYPFNVFGTFWFMAGPVLTICANRYIDKWVRESVVCFVQHSISAFGHLLFLMLTVPSKANQNFPYHVRTTQIDVMECTNGFVGNNCLDHFGHHPYAPGGEPLDRSFTISRHWQPNAPSHTPKDATEEVFKFCRPGTNHSDAVTVRLEDVQSVPDFTAPIHKNTLYDPN